MLYPKIKNIKKSKAVMNISIIVTVFISATLILINYSLQEKFLQKGINLILLDNMLI